MFRVGGERMNMHIRNIDGPRFGSWVLDHAGCERCCCIMIIVLSTAYVNTYCWWLGRHSWSDWIASFPREDMWSGLLCCFRIGTVIQYRFDVFVACEVCNISWCNVLVPELLDHSLANRVACQAMTVQPALLSHSLNHVSQFFHANPLHHKPLAIRFCQILCPWRNVKRTSCLTLCIGSFRGKQLEGCNGTFFGLCGIQPRRHFPDVWNINPAFLLVSPSFSSRNFVQSAACLKVTSSL